jgi:hypothetical protein
MSHSVKPMRAARGMTRLACIALVLLGCCALSVQSLSGQKNNEEYRDRNIVLVHGARADGSGWKGVYDILRNDC